MRIAALALALSIAPVTLAKPHQWTPAKVVESFSDTSDRGTAAIPLNGSVYKVRILVTTVWYRFQTADIVYTVAWHNKKHPLNVTIQGETKVYADGPNLHILDDDGKDVKAPITEKFAAPKPTPLPN
jgi:hypothetical protein